MAKRFSDTEIWKEDWYLLMPPQYKLLWKFITDTCDHAGIWRSNLVHFETFNGKVDLEKALEYFNTEKDRIRKLPNGKYFLPDFFVFQYGNVVNLNNRLHVSIFEIYKKNDISELDLRGLLVVKQTPSTPLVSPQTRGLLEDNIGVKDKEKDIIINNTIKNNNRGKFEKPSVGMVTEYFREREIGEAQATEEANKFMNHYDSKNWFVGKNKMTDWKASVRNWITRMQEKGLVKKPITTQTVTQQSYGNLFGGFKDEN